MSTMPTILDREHPEVREFQASRLRKRFLDSGTLVINMIGPEGAGKTSLLERTLACLPSDCWAAVLVGDRQTQNDRRRLGRFGFPIRQVGAGDHCHLNAAMIEQAIEDWELNTLDLLLIENVSNLSCPPHYDLGEAAKIAVVSVTESVDEPLKHASLFSAAELMILNKVDLLPSIQFSVEQAVANAHRIHPRIDVILTSCASGEGLNRWMCWLNHRATVLRKAA